jgi:uncharacterized membrane-anchored protein YhcB (DUF1043 family)
VVTHFNTTANLVKKLTQSYQEVQDHLAEAPTAWPWTSRPASACWPPCTPTRLPQRRERLTPPASNEAAEGLRAKPPNAPGMLDEHYGLKK